MSKRIPFEADESDRYVARVMAVVCAAYLAVWIVEYVL